ncbi:MAG: hypothetical protein HYW48_01925 [Deltaproteobacteria bacterium]|nr:hypothetical protein [Deltaproteobacteria bacterium]
MNHLIHQDYLKDLILKKEEASDLYDALLYYGKRSTVDAAEDMLETDDPLPLDNHWQTVDDFINVWEPFYEMARKLKRNAFVQQILSRTMPKEIHLTPQQESLFSDKQEYMKQACYLLSFLDSMSDYFEYEVEMLERGYPHGHRSAG